MAPMNPRLLRPTASGFDPRRIAGLEAWFDALTPTSYTEVSGQISEWRSLVGSLSVEEATGNNRPTLFESSGNVQGATRSEINGRQSFYFDGANDRLISTATGGSANWTAFAACKPQSVTGTRGLLSRDPAGGAPVAIRGPQFLRHSNGVPQAIAFSTATSFVATAATLTNNTAVILSAVQTASTVQIFVNNVGGTAIAATQNTSVNPLRVGVSGGITEFWLGAIGEILLYQRDLNASERLAVHTYLSKRWGV
jgi:hypothetical protein